MKLKDIDRTATVAWGPHQSQTYLATGTMSGALDASFSNKSELELFKLDFTDDAFITEPWKPSAVIDSNARFNRITWGAISEDKPHGIIAGGMENGELALWNAASILDQSSPEDALIMSNTNHTGCVRGLDFNPFQSNLLASAAGNGEIFIWDLTNPAKPYSPGPRSQRLDDITSLSWNNQVQHILATSSTTGYTVVWDLKNRREVMHMAYPGASMGMGGRGGITAVAWNPDNATQLVTASEDDNNPVIMMWDLRNAHAPERILSGHSKGVLSLSWCKMDSDLLLSTGKDCRTLCWNPRVGEVVGELPPSSNWAFDVQWCHKNPNLLSTASFDGKVNVFSLQSGTNDSDAAEPVFSQAKNDDPFSAQNYPDPSSSSFSLKQAPKWLRPPVGGTFSFGGKLVSFGKNAQESSNTTVSIATVVSEPELVKRSQELEAALESNNLQEFCEARASSITDKDEHDNWKILKILFESDARDRLISHLGFEKEALVAQITEKVSKMKVDEETSEDETSSPAPDSEVCEPEPTDSESLKADENVVASADSESVSQLFSDGDDKDSLDFFGQQPEQTDFSVDEQVDPVPQVNELPRSPRLPFKFNHDENTDVDRLITRAITLGDFESAVDICLKSDRLSDALILAVCGGGDLLVRTQQVYFEQKSQSTPYIRILRSVISGDLEDIVENADIGEWDEILATLCTYSSPENFTDLCEKLGSRLEAEWRKNAGRDDDSMTNDIRHHAIVCYLASGNINKVLKIWIAQESESEAIALANQNCTRSQVLQDFIEKLSILKKAINYDESSIGTEHEMSQLYRKYLDYAEILVSQGQLATAVKYLNYVPSDVYEGDMNEAMKCSIIKDRIYNSGIGADAMPAPEFPFEFVPVGFEGEVVQAQPEQSFQTNNLPATSVPSNPTTYPSTTQSQQYYNQYNSQVGYQPEVTAPSYPASNTFPTQVQQNYYTPSSASPYGAYQQQPSVPAYNVPSAFSNSNYPTQTPSAPPVIPASQQKSSSAWNDPPMATLTGASSTKQRASTPKVTPITSPFPNAVSTPASPNVGFAVPPMGRPLAPPSRPGSGLGGHSQANSPNANSFQTAPNSYGGGIPSIPTPGSNTFAAGYPTSNSPINPYQQGIQRGASPMIPQPPSALPPNATHITGKPVSKPSSPAPAPEEPAKPKYPPGDRTHIPSAHVPIYQKLSGEFQRIRQVAPANQKRMLDDIEKRLNLLFDALNLESLPKDIVEKMLALTQALENRDFNTAQQIHLELVTTKFAIVGQWMVGVKRLIELVRSHSGM